MHHRRCLGGRAILLARWGVAVTGVLVMTSCGTQSASSSSGDPSLTPISGAPIPPPPPLAVPPASSLADADTKAAVGVYAGMWQAMAQAGETSDWQSPELDHYATGEALATIIRSLYADHMNGVFTHGAPTNSPVVRSVEPPQDPTTVLIDDCGDSTHWLKYRLWPERPAGGGPGGGLRFITAEVLRQPDGAWRVNRFAVQGLGTC